MPHGDFVWCDLSAYTVNEAKAFYADLFGWTYETMPGSDGAPYTIASVGAHEAAAVFAMPDRFRQMKLPSFWMSYIAVDDAARAVARARELGGKVEVGPVPYGRSAKIALIRDPLGAGFTVYEGQDLSPRSTAPRHGQMAWNALYVSDASAVIPFYEALFDWSIAPGEAEVGRYRVLNARGDHVSDIHELSEDIRGKFQYWAPHFAVDDLGPAKAHVTGHHGKILYEEPDRPSAPVLAVDTDGAAFFLVPRARGGKATRQSAGAAGGFRWKTLLALALIWAAVMLEQNWVWGVLFLLWTVLSLKTGQTFFVERLSRAGNPLLYWAVIGTWIVLSAWLILADLMPWSAGG